MAVGAIDTELEIVAEDWEYRKRFVEPLQDRRHPVGRWGGNVADLIEYHIAPQAAGLLQHPSGMPMEYEEAVGFLEHIYGVTVSNPSDRRAKILERVENTAFQDTMRKVFLLEADKQIVKSPRK